MVMELCQTLSDNRLTKLTIVYNVTGWDSPRFVQELHQSTFEGKQMQEPNKFGRSGEHVLHGEIQAFCGWVTFWALLGFFGGLFSFSLKGLVSSVGASVVFGLGIVFVWIFGLALWMLAAFLWDRLCALSAKAGGWPSFLIQAIGAGGLFIAVLVLFRVIR